MSSAQERSDTEGIKETERFVKAGDKMSQAVADAKLQVQNTLTNYNTLVAQPATDMKGAYKKLLKNVKDMNDKVTDARLQVDEMQSTGDVYFAGRAGSIKKDPERGTPEPGAAAARVEPERVCQRARRTAGGGPVTRAGSQGARTIRSTIWKRPLAQRDRIIEGSGDEGAGRLRRAFGKSDTAMKKAGDYFNGLRAR